MQSNNAAWLVASKSKLEVGPAQYPVPTGDEVAIKNHAIAINPIDWALQAGVVPYTLNYPHILGQDVSGEVVGVGGEVTRFKVGDRVLGQAIGMGSRRPCDGAFQEYTILHENVCSPIPQSLSYQDAAVIPLGLSTAACGLYQKNFLELEYPSVNPKSTGKTLLVWGGASSVGSNAVQLAKASGYDVVTTCSAKNFDYVKSIGATEAFDYSSKTIVDDVVGYLRGKTLAGAIDCITVGSLDTTAEIVRQVEGSKIIAVVKRSPEEMPGGIRVKSIFGNTLQGNEVGNVVFRDYLPKALDEGKFIPSPKPVVIGNGLSAIQDGIDAWRKGASASKVVVTLD